MKTWAILLSLTVAGCGAHVAQGPVAPVQSGPVPVVGVDRRLAECRLLEAAYAETIAQKGAAPRDILVGCPGREGWSDEMPLAAQTASLRLANAASLPPEVARAGAQAARAYRRMLTRGVEEAIARRVVQGPAFAAMGGFAPLASGRDLPTCLGETVAYCR